ncbi:MAG: hypothetical protein RIS76_615, partial [Verrucomicrobiota bacterium]
MDTAIQQPRIQLVKKLALVAAFALTLSTGWLLRRQAPPNPASPDVVPSLVPGQAGSGQTGPAGGPDLSPTSSAGATAGIPALPAPIAALPPIAPWMRPAVRRTWDPGWLQEFAGKSGPLPIQFELVNGEMAEGVVKVVQSQGGEVVSI